MKVSLRDTAIIPPLAALVYRFGKGCRQYAFETADDLASWASRHPYKNELLRVMPVKDGKILADRWMPAEEAADYVRHAAANPEIPENPT